MDREILNRHRKQLLADVGGEVLEIGFGTGANLPFYPTEIGRLTTIDPNPGVTRRARRRVQASPIAVDQRIATAERLPLADNSFDVVISTLTLCSIPDAGRALGEIYRVLKPGGRFLFLEHGCSPEPQVKRWQDRLTPFSKAVGDGCHLNRDIRRLIEARPFVTLAVNNFYLSDAPKIAGYMYQGAAQKS